MISSRTEIKGKTRSQAPILTSFVHKTGEVEFALPCSTNKSVLETRVLGSAPSMAEVEFSALW